MSSSSKALLDAKGLRPKKSFGQNFMVDQQVNARIARAVSAIGGGADLLEIGAGTGSLTEHLLGIAPVVHAIERDRDLLPILKERFLKELKAGRLVLHEADGARFDLNIAFSEEKPGVLVGNLPYHLTSSIALLALKYHKLLRGAVFLVQREVADRLSAHPGNKQYGFLTVIMKLAFDIKKVSQVDRGAFWPKPEVDSTVISLNSCDRGIGRVRDLKALIAFVRTIFQKRRKKLSTIFSGSLSKEQLEHLGIDADLRPENIAPEQFLEIFLISAESDVV